LTFLCIALIMGNVREPGLPTQAREKRIRDVQG
jgi:hypothetical protein